VLVDEFIELDHASLLFSDYESTNL
jgi:hypothetical protein